MDAAAVHPTDEELATHRKLMEPFRGLKFTETEADLLASAHADPDRAKKLLDGGCPHALCVRILL